MASNSQAMPVGYLLSPHIAFQGYAVHTARWPATLSPNGSSGTCMPDGVDHIPMPCLHGATELGLMPAEGDSRLSTDRKISATRQGWSKGIGGGDTFMKLC